MRRLIGLAVLLAAIWSVWWGVASFGLRAGLEAWLSERRAAGWQAEADSISVSGYPTELALSMQNFALADPLRGVAISFPSLDHQAPAWRPGKATLRFPQAPMTVSVPGRSLDIRAEQAIADLWLKPTRGLMLERMALGSGPWQLTEPAGDVASARDLRLEMVQDSADEMRYEFVATASGFAPGAGLRADWRVPDRLPDAFETLTVQASVVFSRPWDLAAIEGARPQPRSIDLTLVEAAWGALLLRATGAVTVDAEGIPEGEISLQVRNWREMLSLAENAGVLPPQIRPQIERALGLLASAGGNNEAIDVTLTLANETISLGFLPLAPAPRLILR